MSKFYLKDWHGKEKEFTDDKIFVRGENGELIQFTQGEGDKPAVVQPLEVTENGTYTAPDGVDGYSPVTVNVKGGGGGLPAGGYWKQFPQMFSYAYCQVYVHNGKPYFYSRDSDTDTKYDVYVFEDGVYTKIATDVTGSVYKTHIDYNGQLHLFSEWGYHFVVNEEWKEISKAKHTDGNVYKLPFVMDGELYKKDKTNFYKWVEASDTWESVAVANCPTTDNDFLLVHNRNLYIISYGTLYKVDWDAKTCTTVRTDLPKFRGQSKAHIIGDYIYFMYNAQLYKYDINADTYAVVSELPNNFVYLYKCNNRLCFYGYDKTFPMYTHMEYYEVTE